MATAPPEVTAGTEEAAAVEVPAMPAAMEPAAAAPAEAPAAPAPAQPAPAPLSDPIDELVRRLEEAPDDTATRLALAGAYEQRDDYTHAAEQYRKLIKGRTVPAPVLDIVAENLRDLVDSRPDDPALHRLLGDVYMKQGQFQMAITQYNWLLAQGGH